MKFIQSKSKYKPSVCVCEKIIEVKILINLFNCDNVSQ